MGASQVRKYLRYRTSFVKQTGEADARFPKLQICSSSLHSRKKIKENYPYLPKLALDEFYGKSVNMYAARRHHHEADFNISTIKLSRNLNWTMLDSIDLREFISSTTPEYFIATCKIELFDCRTFWRQVQTFHGSCIALNVTEALWQHYFLQTGDSKSMEEFEKSFSETLKYWSNVRLTLAFNRTDVTNGWSAIKWPLFLQLAHDDEEYASSNTYAMTEDLIPVLKVVTTEIELLGHPFSECISESKTKQIYAVKINPEDTELVSIDEPGMSLVSINLDLKKPPYDKNVEIPKYKIEDLMADIGGMLTLFLGLTMVEIGQGLIFCIKKAIKKISRRRKKNKVLFSMRDGQKSNVQIHVKKI
ncbi:Oidioi.mRNA.OKI2018_I69.chr1.g1145.t1.cds [Oikopleura dioica]|uniref:Oidioi.mRNA.OKI2018_I69.chr1.g1145.t1.cds n=1 Tax=Oikopleura dioica TaxID=34765 RepID=A0ABN7SS20_OIKDI|nr:Oidioi.mRNA.OKI2018_I69.chr1.g1145.t1.cds [Oikopleura dioica]